MKPILLKGYRLTELSFQNRQNKRGFPLKQEMRYQLRVLSANLCEGTLHLHVFDADAEQDKDAFSLSLAYTGLFVYEKPSEQELAAEAGAEGDAEDAFREKLHKTSCAALYPHAAALVASLTAQAGIPPLVMGQPELNGGVYLIRPNPGRPDDET
jgi:preprotein translocase subunit SecB